MLYTARARRADLRACVNLHSHRRLAEELQPTDLLLQYWSTWAKPGTTGLGFPTRSVTERAREGGILARNVAPYPPEWPTRVAECDAAVGQLPLRRLAAIQAHYFHMTLAAELRAVKFTAIVVRLVRLKDVKLGDIGTVSPHVFPRELRAARYQVRELLCL